MVAAVAPAPKDEEIGIIDEAAESASKVVDQMWQYTVTIDPYKGLARASILYRLTQLPAAGSVVNPKDFFKASNELTLLALIVCWTISLTYDWRDVWHHPARNYVGHLNPCFGWDYPPASYFGVMFAGLDVYLSFTYAILEADRTALLDTDQQFSWVERFSSGTAYAHAAASILWLLLWSVGPPDNNWVVHLLIFTVCVAFRYMCTLGNYVEQRFSVNPKARARVFPKHTYFVIFYGVVTSILPILYFSDMIIYKVEGRTGVDPPIPWYVLEVMDVVWICCLSQSNKFSVPEPPIRITRTVLDFGDSFEVEEKNVNSQRKIIRTSTFARSDF